MADLHQYALEHLARCSCPVDFPDFTTIDLRKGTYNGDESCKHPNLQILYPLPNFEGTRKFQLATFNELEMDKTLVRRPEKLVTDKLMTAMDNGEMPYFYQECYRTLDRPNGRILISNTRYVVPIRTSPDGVRNWRGIIYFNVEYHPRDPQQSSRIPKGRIQSLELVIGDDFAFSDLKESTEYITPKPRAIIDEMTDNAKQGVHEDESPTIARKVTARLIAEAMIRMAQSMLPDSRTDINLDMLHLSPRKRIQHWAMHVADLYEKLD